MSKTLTTASIARLAGCSRSTVRNYSRAGVLTPVVLTDGTRTFDPDDVARVRAAIDSRKRKPAEGEGGS